MKDVVIIGVTWFLVFAVSGAVYYRLKRRK